MAAVGRVHDVVRILMFNGIVKKSDDEFSTTSFVGSSTKSSQNYNNRPSKISPKCTSVETKEEMSESEPDDHEVISRYQEKEQEEEPNENEKIVTKIEIHANSRLEEHFGFVADDVFVKSKEFKSFLYNFKGRRLRESIPHITPENEAELLKRLKEDIEAKLVTMTPPKGRQLLAEARVILFLGWDLSVSFVFDSLLHYDNKDLKLDIQGVNDVFIGSRFDQDEEALLL